MINIVSPGSTVYVIESKSSSLNDIKTAISTAVNLGVNIILMSFGTSEYSTQSSLESMFMNSNISFISSSGDSNIVCYPSTSANVLSIGGTTLTLNNNNTRLHETAFPTAGAGSSIYINKPSYQSDVNNGSKRNTPDLSLVANGVIVYSSVNGGYININGTSIGASLMTGIVAIINQGRKSNNKPMLTSISTSPNCIQQFLYKTIYLSSDYLTCFYDVTSGSDGSYNAGVNDDIATGLGSLNVNNLFVKLSTL